MKTPILLLFLCFATFDLHAQIPPALPQSDAAAAAREQLLRDALRQSGTVITGNSTNVTVIAAPPQRQTEVTNVTTATTSPIPGESVAGAVPTGNESGPRVLQGGRQIIMGNSTPSPEPPGMDDEIPGQTLQFVGADFNEILYKIYAKYVNRTILPSPNLPANLKITLNVVQATLTKREVIQVLETIFAMNGIVTSPVGDKFMKVMPAAEAGPAGTPFSNKNIDSLPDTGSFITYVVQLQYAKPSEIQQILTPYARFAGGIQPIDSSGILVLRDYTENVKRMLEMIKQVDVAVIPDIISEVIPIKYAPVGEIASALNSLGGPIVASVGGRSGTRGARATSTTGRAALSNPLGTTAGTRGTTTGINAPAPINPSGQPNDFSQNIRDIISRAATPNAGGGAGDFQILGETKIIPDERSNSLLVYATRQDMEMIKSIVSKLDVVLPQVLIEAVILDVSLGNDLSLGVSAGQSPKDFNGTVSGGGVINNGNGSLNSGLSFLNNVLSAVGSNNVTTAFPSESGLSYISQIGPTWTVALQALANNSNVKVLSRPSIQTSHNVAANIFVGETRPYISGTYFDGYSSGSRSQYQQSQIGISLDVIPLINPDGLVVMDIQQQVQQASAKGAGVLIDGNEVPITKEEHANATVAVHSGEAIVMGGFIQSEKSQGRSGVPFLQDIPLLGNLFRTTSKSDARRELLVLIRPTVLPTPKIAAAHTEVERDRHPADKMAERVFKNEEDKLLKQADKQEQLDNATETPKHKSLFGRDSNVIEIP